MIDFASYQHFLRSSLEHDIRIDATSCLHDPIWLSGHVLRVSITDAKCAGRYSLHGSVHLTSNVSLGRCYNFLYFRHSIVIFPV
jgi:hypothetical protein